MLRDAEYHSEVRIAENHDSKDLVPGHSHFSEATTRRANFDFGKWNKTVFNTIFVGIEL